MPTTGMLRLLSIVIPIGLQPVQMSPSSISSNSHFLVVQRLRLATALRRLHLTYHLHKGQVLLDTNLGNLPVFLQETRDEGLQVKIPISLPRPETPDGQFLQFIADVNRREQEVAVKLTETGVTVGLECPF